ncbi:MAG: NAD(P)H-binding protein [Acidimicrobiia bacterium]
MEMLVTGASGVLGREVARIATADGHVVRRLSRSSRGGDGWVVGDVGTGDGLTSAVTGVDVIIHCASDPRRHAATDRTGTKNLVQAAQRAGGIHIVFPGIVGCDVIPLGYYKSKTAAEESLEQSDNPHTIQRFTQFHDLLWFALGKLTKWPIVPVPNDTRFQVLDSAVAARCLVEAAEAPAAGRLGDLGGPTVYDVRDLARSVAAAHGRRRRIIGINVPGLVGAAFRAGGNLTEHRDGTGATWNDFVAKQLG